MADETTVEKTPLEQAREKAESEAKAANESRKGVGTRVQVGATRGKNTQVISYEQWDDSQPDTLPKSIAQFMEVTGISDEGEILSRIIRGDNAIRYEMASDPLAEHVSPTWSADVAATFRAACRNYSRGLGISLDDAVSVIRPGFVSKFGE